MALAFYKKFVESAEKRDPGKSFGLANQVKVCARSLARRSAAWCWGNPPLFSRLGQLRDKFRSHLAHHVKSFPTLWSVIWRRWSSGDFRGKSIGRNLDLAVFLFVASQMELHKVYEEFDFRPCHTYCRMLIDC